MITCLFHSFCSHNNVSASPTLNVGVTCLMTRLRDGIKTLLKDALSTSDMKWVTDTDFKTLRLNKEQREQKTWPRMSRWALSRSTNTTAECLSTLCTAVCGDKCTLHWASWERKARALHRKTEWEGDGDNPANRCSGAHRRAPTAQRIRIIGMEVLTGT